MFLWLLVFNKIGVQGMAFVIGSRSGIRHGQMVLLILGQKGPIDLIANR